MVRLAVHISNYNIKKTRRFRKWRDELMHYDSDMLYIAQMEKGEKLYHYTTIDALINIVSKKNGGLRNGII